MQASVPPLRSSTDVRPSGMVPTGLLTWCAMNKHGSAACKQASLRKMLEVRCHADLQVCQKKAWYR